MQENESAAAQAGETFAASPAMGDAQSLIPTETAETTENTTDTPADMGGAEDSTPEAATQPEVAPEEPEEITYHAVQKDGDVTAIWEMQGRKHIRTIDPRSREGLEILRLFTAEEGEEAAEAAV